MEHWAQRLKAFTDRAIDWNEMPRAIDIRRATGSRLIEQLTCRAAGRDSTSTLERAEMRAEGWKLKAESSKARDEFACGGSSLLKIHNMASIHLIVPVAFCVPRICPLQFISSALVSRLLAALRCLRQKPTKAESQSCKCSPILQQKLTSDATTKSIAKSLSFPHFQRWSWTWLADAQSAARSRTGRWPASRLIQTVAREWTFLRLANAQGQTVNLGSWILTWDGSCFGFEKE